MKKKRYRFLLLALILFRIFSVSGLSAGTLPDGNDLDLGMLEEAVNELDELTEDRFSFSGMMTAILNGDFSFSPQKLADGFLSLLFEDMRDYSVLAAQLLLLGIVAAVFHVFRDSFPEGGAGKIGEYVIYLAFLLPAVDCFRIAADLARDAVGRSSDFLAALFPYLLSSFALSGGAAAASVVQPTILAMTSFFLELVDDLIMPILLFMVVLAVCSELSPNAAFRGLISLLRGFVLAVLALVMTVFSGVLSLESFAAGTVDGLSAKTVKMAAGDFIPVVGGYLADAFDAVVGAGLLLRSSIGIFGIAAIAVFLLLPALKILVMAVVFKISAALLEPFGEGRYVGALTDFGDVMLLLFAVVIVTGLLFFFLIFSVIGVSAMTMMFR